MAIALIAGLASMASAFLLELGVAWYVAFAVGAGLSMVSRALMPSPDLGAQMGGRSVTTREAAHSRKIVYGRARLGGNIVYLESTGTDNKYLWLVVAVAGHEIDAYESLWFNDEKIWEAGSYIGNWGTYVQVGFHKGDQTAADSALDAASTKWTSAHILHDTAYMVVKLTYDRDQFGGGLPNISTIIRGKKVLNPNGGVTAWSQNPALCIYDYLRDTKYGLGETTDNILTASVNTAKGVCDEAITLAAGGTQPRYTIDGVIDTAGSLKSNIELMTGAMAGRLVYSGGQFEIHAGEYIAPTITVDESQIVGEITVQTKQSRRSAFNGVKGVFLSSDDNYILADYPAQVSKTVAGSFEVGKRYQIVTLVNGGSSTDFTAIGASANTVGIDFTATGVGTGTGTASLFLAQDGHQIFLDMALPFTVDNIRAQRLAKLALLRSRQQEAITIPCNLSALRFKIGDNISVTNVRLGYSAKVFEVVGYSMGFSSDGQIAVNVEAIETAASIWDWTTTDEEVFLGGGEVALYSGKTAVAPTSIGVSAVTFIAADGTTNSSFDVTWTASDDAFIDHYVVEWRLNSATNYFSQDTRSSPFTINSLESSQVYNVRVKAINEIGVSSSYITSDPTAATDSTAPALPTSITATAGYKSISLAWTNPSAKDFNNVEIWRSGTSGGTYVEVSNVAGGYSAKAEYLNGGLSDATAYFYKFKSVDLTGNKTSTTDFNNQTAVTATTNAGAVDGFNTAVVYGYVRSASTVTNKPSTTRTWTFSTASFDVDTLGNSFTAEIPSGTDDIYFCSATVTSRDATVSVIAANWSAAQLLSSSGAIGKSVYTPFVFKRSSSSLSAPTGGTFNFGTNTLTPPTSPDTWYAAIPSGTDPVYACNFTFAIAGDTGTVTATTWSTPVISSENGDDAVSTFTYPVYQRNSTAPTVAPTGGSYNFSTNAITAPSGWYDYIPTGSDPAYASIAKAQIAGATGTDSSIVYLAPTLAFQNGDSVTGATGPRNASGYLYYSVSQAGVPTTPTATGYNFATGAFSGGSRVNWSRTVPEATGGDQQFWASSYLVSESAYGTIGSIVFSTAFSSINFDGLVTFTNLNTALATEGGNVTTIDGGLIKADSVILDVDIKVGSGSSVFKVDSDGIYLGNETFGVNAPFRVSPAGTLHATDATITGAITANSLSIGSSVTIPDANLTTTVTSGASAGASALQDGDTGVDLGLNDGTIGGIYIDAAKLYSGSAGGVYEGSTTGFYLGSDGKFSLSDKLSFDSGATDPTLSITGNLIADSVTVGTGANSVTMAGGAPPASGLTKRLFTGTDGGENKFLVNSDGSVHARNINLYDSDNNLIFSSLDGFEALALTQIASGSEGVKVTTYSEALTSDSGFVKIVTEQTSNFTVKCIINVPAWTGVGNSTTSEADSLTDAENDLINSFDMMIRYNTVSSFTNTQGTLATTATAGANDYTRFTMNTDYVKDSVLWFFDPEGNGTWRSRANVRSNHLDVTASGQIIATGTITGLAAGTYYFKTFMRPNDGSGYNTGSIKVASTNSRTFSILDNTADGGFIVNDGASQTVGAADITSVTAGTNLNGGGLSGGVTLNLDSSISLTNLTLGGYLRGPATFTIDPAAHGDDTGTVVIAGNLQVDGTTTTIDSTVVEIADLNFKVAKNATTNSMANTGGLTVGGSNAELKYIAVGDKWTMNKPLDITGTVTSSGMLYINQPSSNANNELIIMRANDVYADQVWVDNTGSIRLRTDNGTFSVFTGGAANSTSASGSTTRLSIGATGAFDFKTNNLTNIGTISATGYNDTNWNTAYTTANLALPKAGGTMTGEIGFNDTAKWNVSSADAAHQRADARDDDTSKSRLHWFGVTDNGSTSNFRHAWYDGATYINVTAASGTATFGGIIAATGGTSTNWNSAYTYSQLTKTTTLSSDVTGTATEGANGTTTITATVKYPVNGDWWNGGFIKVGTDGVMEVGKYLDFHTADSGGGTDYDLRVYANAGALVVSGTIAATDGSSSNWNSAYTTANLALPKAGGTVTGDVKWSGGSAPYIEDASNEGRIPAPAGAHYSLSATSATGAFKIKLPTATNNNSTMLSFEVRLFDYDERESVVIQIAGYAYSSGVNWNRQAVQILSSTSGRDYTVRFGSDGTSNCLWIGELTSTWSYPKLGIFNLMVGHSVVPSEFSSGWAITLVTAFDTVQDTITANLPYASVATSLSGQTSTIAELNYTDGVTSSIQTQLNSKLNLSGGTVTGALTATSAVFSSFVQADALHLQDMGDYLTFYGNNNADHSISSRSATGAVADDLRFNSYGAFHINLDSNSNNSSGKDFTIGKHGSSASQISNLLTISGETGGITNNALNSLGEVHTKGMVRASGWYNTQTGSTTGPALEIGFSGNPHVLAYDRDASAYSVMTLTAQSFSFTAGGGTGDVNVANGSLLIGGNPVISSARAITASTVGVTNIVTNKVVKFNGTILDDSNITDTGSLITLGSNTTISGTVGCGTVTSTGYVNALGLGVSGANGTDGRGISLYGGASSVEPTYGLMFQQTATFATHGTVNGSWATYFTMNSSAGRGWIFRNVSNGNVASIENDGNATFNGIVTSTGMDIGSGNIAVDSDKGFVNSGAWTQLTTPYGYISLGPANGSWAHIYTDRPAFYTNKDIYVTNQKVYHTGDPVLLTTGGTMTGGMEFNDVALWNVSSGDSAHQRADARDDDGNQSRLHWFGKTDTAGTSNFRHAWYDGSAYINVTAASGAVTFSGSITATGNVTAYSDERLKENIQTLDGKKVLQMRGVSFTKDGQEGSGVIAQELEKVAPELVHDGEEYKSVAYGNITGYLIEAIKDQQKEIDELKTLVKQLLESK